MNQTLIAALSVAAFLHRNHKRKGTKTPYIVHLMDVASNLIKAGADDNLITAGILHDTIEDTEYSEAQLKQDFGNDIYKLVMSNTEPDNRTDISDKNKMISWKERKAHSIKYFKGKSRKEMLLFAADKLSNLKDIFADQLVEKSKLWNRFNAGKNDIQWYYFEILSVLKSSKIKNIRMVKEFEEIYKLTFKDN